MPSGDHAGCVLFDGSLVTATVATAQQATASASVPTALQRCQSGAAPDTSQTVYHPGTQVQVTADHSHKTQPAWSPDGRQLAFTVWNYDAQFWRMR